MLNKVATRTSLVVVLTLVLAAAPAKAGPERGKGGGPKPDPTVEKTLWWQSYQDQAIYSSDEPSQNDNDTQAADDFVVPSGRTWRITKVEAEGYFYSAPIPTAISYYSRTTLANPTVNVFFYATNGSLPGAEIKAFRDLTVPNSQYGRLEITLPESVTLGPGTYWVSVQANIDYVPHGGWYWFVSSNFGEDHRAAWRDPANYFGTGCTDWGVMQDCTGTWWGDLAFTLTGFES